jgi:hypothetical protein
MERNRSLTRHVSRLPPDQGAEGTLSFVPELDVGFAISGASIQEAHAIARGKLTATLYVEGDVKKLVHENPEVELWKSPTFKIPLSPIGVIPVKMESQLTVKAGFKLDTSGALTAVMGAGLVATEEVGFRYTAGGMEGVQTFTVEKSSRPPTITDASATVAAKAYLSAIVSLNFYAPAKAGAAAVTLTAQPYVQFDASPVATPAWGLKAGFTADMAVNLRALWKSWTPLPTKRIYEQEWPLLPSPADSTDPVSVDSGKCGDGTRDGAETGADCGGSSTCGPCPTSQGCVDNSDCDPALECLGGSCAAKPPAACTNGTMDAGESQIDCGGSCPGCHADACTQGGDCKSGNCSVENTCSAAFSCSDGVMGGAETAVDCGGGCDGCSEGAACKAAGDCAGHKCLDGSCASVPSNCNDGVLDGDETGPDCGGSCAACTSGAGGTGGGADAGTCPSPHTMCGTACADLQTDERFCGNCQTTCAAGDICQAGACVTGNGGAGGGSGAGGSGGAAGAGETGGGPGTGGTGGAGGCTAGLTDCGGTCVDTQTSPGECGACGTPCSSDNVTPACSAGSCTGACTTGFDDCNRDKRSDGCEKALGTDTDCSACGDACAAQKTCLGGQCQ